MKVINGALKKWMILEQNETPGFLSKLFLLENPCL